MKPATESTLMGLPLEVRAKILGYLLPNLSEIKVFDGYYDGFNAVNRNWYAEAMEDANVEDDRNITQRVASMVQFRDDGAQCHTAILRVNRQLYIDGTAIMYNRAFRAVITARGITFLKFRFPSARERHNTDVILAPGDLQYFPFHLAKQIQIEIWATLFAGQQDVYLYSALLDLCLVLSDKPSLRNVRVSLYDRTYRPKPEPKSQDCKADDDGPYPPQDEFQGDVLNESFQRTAEEKEFWGDVWARDYYDQNAEPWEQTAVRGRIYWGLPRDDGPRGLELALEPLKLLANVGRARINLTPEIKKHQDMLAYATKLQNSMMHEGLRHEIEMICTRCRLRPISEVHTCQSNKVVAAGGVNIKMSHPSGGKGGGSQKSQGLGDDKYTVGDSIFKPDGGIPTPDLEITKKEDENILLAKEASTKTITQDLDLPLRPGYGGRQFIMRTNYFQVTLDTKKELVKYNVKIEPAPDSSARALQNGRKRRHFYKILFRDQPDFQALGHGIATDYANTLFTCGRLYTKSLPSKEYLQVYRSEMEQRANQDSTAQSSEQKYKVTVEYTGVVSSSELIRYVNSRPDDPSDFNSRLDAVQAMNIIVAGSPNKNEAIFQAGQNKFFQYPTNVKNQQFDQVYQKYNLDGGLIAVRGYYSSVRTSTSRILLNLNAQCSAFYPEINLRELMYVFVGKDDKDDENEIPSTSFQDLEEFIQRLRVRTEQITREGKTVTREKTIRGFSHKYELVSDKNRKKVLNADGNAKMKGTKGADHDYGSSDLIKFLNEAHSPSKVMSVSEYFLEQYGNPLKYPKELVVNCGTDESPKWIPPERCIVMPGQPYRGTLSERQTTKMLNVAARGPAENARRISEDGLSVIGVQPSSQTLNAFGITVGTKMLPVHARLLPVPSVMYHNASVAPNNAEWNLHKKYFFRHVPIDKWSYLTLGKTWIKDPVWNLFQPALKACGMGEVQPDPFEGFRADLPGNGDNDMNDAAIRGAMSSAQKLGIRILWVVIPFYSAPIYARVKYWADVIYGIHTVCVLDTKLCDKGIGQSMMYYANVTHKFNLKLGGINHKVSEEDLGVISKEATMVVGIDVTHPAPRSMEDAPSTVGMVASVDNQFGQWPGSLKIQTGRQEILKRRKEKEEKGVKNLPEGEEVMVERIEDMFNQRLNVYYATNRKLPTNILIYRDGVSESQYQAVLDLELKPIRERCKQRYDEKKTPPPKITIVIVAKRHHTRFYPTDSAYVDKAHFASKDDKNKGNSLGNPLNGTVVDRGITMHKGWDFYLQSHSALKGTARPTHYVVIHDEIGLGEGKLEKITHNLCYHYGIATKAVSICPPAYYADILCERGRCYLMKHLSMRDKPPGTKFVMEKSPWKAGVHQNLQNSMFYI